MSNLPDWLPDLLLLEDFGGDWQRYEDEVYSAFYGDFIQTKPFFEGKPVFIKRELTKGKERSFWHCIQEGLEEEARMPDLRRCERIKWIRAIIDHADNSNIKTWLNMRKGKTRQLLWLEDAEFLVVFERRPNAWVLWTAYPVTEDRRKEKLRREYKEYLKKPTPP